MKPSALEGYETEPLPELAQEWFAFSDDQLALRGVRQAALVANFRRNVGPFMKEEGENPELRPHQPGIFQELDGFFANTAHQKGRSVMLPLPPNAGKSTMAAFVAGLAGVGDRVEGDRMPLKGVTFVPWRNARHQTMKTYQRFVPDLRTREYRGQSVSRFLDDADMSVMTYKKALLMPPQEWSAFMAAQDMVVLDEAHRGIGPQTSALLRSTLEATQPTVLVMSATPEFDEDRTVCKALGIEHSTTPITPREAIGLGISNGVRLYALYSGEMVDLASKRESVTEQDLVQLVDNEKRNTLIVDTMHDMTKTGQVGLVQCIPGGQSGHAQLIAREAQKRTIFDKRLGKERYMRVQAVGNFRTPKENDRIVAAFQRGELDALTFTNYLTEAFDHPLDYLIAAAPKSSMVDMGQFTGRGARLNERLTSIFTLVDRYSGRVPKRLRTPFDVYGEECINQGLIIGKPGTRPPRKTATEADQESRLADWLRSKKDRSESSDSSANPPPDAFSPAVREALDAIPSGTVLDELLLVQTEFATAPEDYIPLVELPAIKRGIITPEGARYALASETDEDGRPVFVSVRTGKYAQYVLPAAEVILSKRCIDTTGRITRMEIDSFLVGEGWPRPSFDIVVKACKATQTEFVVSKGTFSVDIAGAERVLGHLAATPLVDPQVELAIADLAQAIGHTSSSQLMKLVKQNEEVFGQFLRKRRRGVPPAAYKIIEAIELEAAVRLLHEAISSSPKLRETLGTMEPRQIVEEAQANALRAQRRRRLRASISRLAVQGFASLAVELDPDLLAETHRALEQLNLKEIPARLDESFVLSQYGDEWVNHMACDSNEAVNLFYSSRPTDIRKAKQICQDCAVKGDCLLVELRQPSDQVAAGFTSEERETLPKAEVIAWLEGEKANHPDK